MILSQMYNPKLFKKPHFSNPGSSVKQIFQFDVISHELLHVRDIDFQQQIQSFYDTTNYKELLEKLHATENPQEVILQRYPQNQRLLYGDSTLFSETYLDNFYLVKELSKFKFSNDIKPVEKAEVKSTNISEGDVKNV